MKRRLTRRAIIIAGSSLLLFLAATTAQAGWIYVLAAGVLGLVVSSVFMRQRLGDVEVTREVAPRVRAGHEVRVGLRIANRGRRRSAVMRLDDTHPAFGPSAVLVSPLGPRETITAEEVRVAERRGAFTGGQVRLRSGAPFGFLRSDRTVDVPTAITVVPRWVDLRTFPILEPSSAPSDVLHERARTGAGVEYIGVREYRPGDPPRAVHWRSTARAGRLVVREFEEELGSRVALVVAGGDLGEAPDSPFETIVSAAASIGLYALNTGHPVQAVRAGPGGDPAYLERADGTTLLEWLAAAQPGETDLAVLARAAAARAGRRSTIVLLVTTAGPAARSCSAAVRDVQASGCRVILVTADAATWSDGQGDGSALPASGVTSDTRMPFKTLTRGADLRRCLEG